MYLINSNESKEVKERGLGKDNLKILRFNKLITE